MSRSRPALLCLALAAVCCAPAARSQTAAAVGDEVVVPAGRLHAAGRDARGVLAFLGIPYAAPPVGELRWRSPQPAFAWKGLREATKPGTSCAAGEDCLALSIWTAARTSDEKRPVTVRVHGDGFLGARPRAVPGDGGALAAQGAVVVDVNYRLGVFGFLAHPGLDREKPPSGNYGLQDQIAALKWVQANIARFGGNPADVTLLGESTGACAVELLVSSPRAKGLFQQTSGAHCDEHFALLPHAEALARGTALTAQLGKKTIEGLRALPADVLAKAGPQDLFQPGVDGYVLPDAGRQP